MNLGELLSSPGILQNPGNPSSTPAPTQPVPQNDPQFEQKKQGWLNAFQEMAAQPENAMMLLQMGNALQNSQGMSTGQALSDAIMQGFEYRGRVKKLLDEQKMREAESRRADQNLNIQQQRADYEGQRAEEARRQGEFARGPEFEETKRRAAVQENIDLTRAEAALLAAQKATSAVDKEKAIEAGARDWQAYLKQQGVEITWEQAKVEAREASMGRGPFWEAMQRYKADTTAFKLQSEQDFMAGKAGTTPAPEYKGPVENPLTNRRGNPTGFATPPADETALKAAIEAKAGTPEYEKYVKVYQDRYGKTYVKP